MALLGTNGAGKSTLLRAISGVTEADYGAVVFDGRDITHAPPHEIAALGVGQMPGGKAVFADLTVAENLRAGGWTVRRDRAARDRRGAQALASFPRSRSASTSRRATCRAGSSRCSASQ